MADINKILTEHKQYLDTLIINHFKHEVVVATVMLLVGFLGGFILACLLKGVPIL